MCKKVMRSSICIVLCCIAMAVVDGILQPGYAVKSAVKILLFFALPAALLYPERKYAFSFTKPDKGSVIWGFGLGLLTLGVILGGYHLLRHIIDLSSIPDALSKDAGITADNFLYVSLYICLCNSFLEEFFFRGFAYLYLKKNGSEVFACIFSAAAFAVYHCAILDGWFSPVLYALILVALFGCGLLFNLLDRRRERIWLSWLIHLFANLGINVIGMKLLGMF